MVQKSLDYLAGIIDGEGYLGILKNKSSLSKKWNYYYSSAVKVASTDKRMPIMLQNEFGGYLSDRLHPQVNHKNSYSWEIKNDTQVLNFLDKIQDKLVIKSDQAKVLREMVEFRNSIRHRMFQGYTEEDFGVFEDLYLQIRHLNYRGIRPATTKCLALRDEMKR